MFIYLSGNKLHIPLLINNAITTAGKFSTFFNKVVHDDYLYYFDSIQGPFGVNIPSKEQFKILKLKQHTNNQYQINNSSQEVTENIDLIPERFRNDLKNLVYIFEHKNISFALNSGFAVRHYSGNIRIPSDIDLVVEYCNIKDLAKLSKLINTNTHYQANVTKSKFESKYKSMGFLNGKVCIQCKNTQVDILMDIHHKHLPFSHHNSTRIRFPLCTTDFTISPNGISSTFKRIKVNLGLNGQKNLQDIFIVSLEELILYKMFCNRDKDINDIKLLLTTGAISPNILNYNLLYRLCFASACKSYNPKIEVPNINDIDSMEKTTKSNRDINITQSKLFHAIIANLNYLSNCLDLYTTGY